MKSGPIGSKAHGKDRVTHAVSSTMHFDEKYHKDDSEESESSEDDSPKRSRPDPYTTKELCRSLIGTPQWDGKPQNWSSFMKEWKVFWGFQRDLAGPKAKRWIFIKSLPEKWRDHMKAYITDAEWSYKDIVRFLDRQNDIILPGWKKEDEWRRYVPKGNSYMDYTHWWMKWRRLGGECDLREVDWTRTFNACMNHKGYFTEYLKEMMEAEVCENTTWDLKRKHDFMSNKLMIAFKAQETMISVSPQSERKVATCYHCGEEGHYKTQCPKMVLTGLDPVGSVVEQDIMHQDAQMSPFKDGIPPPAHQQDHLSIHKFHKVDNQLEGDTPTMAKANLHM